MPAVYRSGPTPPHRPASVDRRKLFTALVVAAAELHDRAGPGVAPFRVEGSAGAEFPDVLPDQARASLAVDEPRCQLLAR